MSIRRRTAAILLALAGVAGSIYVVLVWPMLTREPIDPPEGELPQSVVGAREPIAGQFVGHSESSIVERFGPPSHRWKGHYGAPPAGYKWRYLDAITATYVRPTGVLYLSF